MNQQQNSTYGKKEFYQQRVPKHFKRLHKHLNAKPFVLFFLAKKNAGKGTYAKILEDITDHKIIHISIGDLVREAEIKAKDKQKQAALIINLKKYYKGKEDLGAIVNSFAKQTESLKLLPTEMVAALIEKAIEDNKGKAIIIDGFPRSLHQVDHALKMQKEFKRQRIPTAFVEIDCPDEVVIERQLQRRICPQCQTSRGLKLLPTKQVEFDEESEEYHLICDNKACAKVRLVPKQSDDLDPEKLKENQQQIKDLINYVRKKAGLNYIIVHNHILVSEADNHNPEDFTLEVEFNWDSHKKQVIKKYKPWVIKDDQGNNAYSRWPDPVVADLVKKLVEWLDKVVEK